MGHRHLHLRKRQRDPLQDIENGLRSAVGGLFGNRNDGNNGRAGRAAATTVDDGPSTVFITASWTGTGEFSYSTQLPDPTPTRSPTVVNPVPTTAPAPVVSIQPTTTLVRSSRPTTSAAAVASSAAAVTTAVSSILSISSETSETSETLETSNTASPAAATSSVAAVAAPAQDSGLSGGAKAGIAIGVILGLIALIALAFFLWRARKARVHEAEYPGVMEKNPFSDAAAADNLPAMPTSQPADTSPVYNDTPVYNAAPVHNPPPVNPFIDGPTSVSDTMITNTGMVTGAATLAFTGATVGGAVMHKKRNSVPAPLKLDRAQQSPALIPPPVLASSPAGSNFSESSLVPSIITVPNVAPPRMHRVQMDFTPNMDDELRIRIGEIVRIVRDFDDGWCNVELVDRDRTNGTVTRQKQGVVPRTCLSRLPLKPRARKDGPAGTSPKKAVPTVLTPGAGRSQSPALASGPVPRSMSPGPYGGGPQDRPSRPAEARCRSNSTNDVGAARPKVAAVGPSPMNPASQAQKEAAVELPIQTQSPLPLPLAPGHSRTESAPFPAPLNPGHIRSISKGSATSLPVARKPVPKKSDA